MLSLFIMSLKTDLYARIECPNLSHQTFLKGFFLVLSRPWSIAGDKSGV